MIRHFYLRLVCLVLIAAPGVAGDDDQTEVENLKGNWRMAYSEYRGLKAAEAPGVVISLSVKGTRWIETTSSKGSSGFSATVKTDDRAAPKTIDLVIKNKDKEVTCGLLFRGSNATESRRCWQPPWPSLRTADANGVGDK